jgi:hypothetical protein
MADGLASVPLRRSRTICLSATEENYENMVKDPRAFRRWVTDAFEESPELFPAAFTPMFSLKDRRVSRKQQMTVRRIRLSDGSAWSVRPSFVMPGMTARTREVEHALFLRKFAVPYWALAHVFGRNHMFWYRIECCLGRFSVVGTTVTTVEIPVDLLADEHHQKVNKDKCYIATTVGGGCVLGADVARTAGCDDLTRAYGVFRQEAVAVQPDYAPKTVNTDGWKATRQAWTGLFSGIVVLLCFLHAWLKIRDRGKHLGQQFFDLGERVWEVYRSPGKRSCAQRIRSLRNWASTNLTGPVLAKTLDLCSKSKHWTTHCEHPNGHRTSNMLDRLMRGMNSYFESGLNFHGSRQASTERARAWALLWNFTPWHPAVTRANNGYQCPAERLNQHRYHNNWLQNLLISASAKTGITTTP